MEDPSDEDAPSSMNEVEQSNEAEQEQAGDAMQEDSYSSSSTSEDMRFLPSDNVLISDFLTTKITNIPYRGNDYIKVIDENPHDLGFFDPEIIKEYCFVDGRLEPERYFYLRRPAPPQLLTAVTGRWVSPPNHVMDYIRPGALGQRTPFQFYLTDHTLTDWRLDQYRLLIMPPGRAPPPDQNWDWTLYKLSTGPLTPPCSSEDSASAPSDVDCSVGSNVLGDDQSGTSRDGQIGSGMGDSGDSVSV